MSGSAAFEQYLRLAAGGRSRLQRVFFFLVLISLVINFRNNLGLYQIGGNPLLFQDVDPVYWLFMLLRIPELAGFSFPLLFDTILVLSCIGSTVWGSRNLAPVIFFIAYFIYFVVFNMMAAHHYHVIGIVFMSFPFVFHSGRRFAYSLMFMRFLFCFVMFSAAAWKIYRGNLFNTDQLFSFMSAYHVENVIASKQSVSADIVAYLLPHKSLLHFFWVLLIGLQSFFFVGVMTLRYDRWLLIGYLMFFIGGWLLMNIYIYDNLLFLFTLLPVVQYLSVKFSAGREKIQQSGL